MTKVTLTLLSFLMATLFVGCTNPQVTAAKQYTTKKDISKELNSNESKIIYWLALENINRTNNCIVSKYTFDNGYRAAHCFTLDKNTIRSKYANIDSKYMYKNMPTIPLEEINTTTDQYIEKFEKLSTEYLMIKSELIAKIADINYSTVRFEEYQTLLENEFGKPQEFYIKHELLEDDKSKQFVFTTPYKLSNSNISNHFILLHYQNPEDIFFLYKKAQKQNPILTLDDFMQKHLKIAYIRHDVNINSKIAKYHLNLSLKNLDKDELGYSITQANADKKVIASLSNVKVDFLPTSYRADDDTLEIEFINKESDNFIVSNKTKKFIQVDALSFYYDSEIVTISVNYLLPPTAVKKFTIDLKKIDSIYLEKSSIKVALALQYRDDSDKKITIYETKNIYKDDIIR